MAANTNDNMNSVNKFLSRKELVDAVHVVISVGCHGEVLLLCNICCAQTVEWPRMNKVAINYS